MGFIFSHKLSRSRVDLAFSAIKRCSSVLMMGYNGATAFQFYAQTQEDLFEYIQIFNEIADASHEMNCVPRDFEAQEVDLTGWKFYVEYETLREKKKDEKMSHYAKKFPFTHSNFTVIAVKEKHDAVTNIPAIAATDNTQNSHNITSTTTSRAYLGMFCKRATLEQALSVHPSLFTSGFFDTDVNIPDEYGYVKADFIDLN